MKNRIKFTAALLLVMQSFKGLSADLDVHSYPSEWDKLSIEEMFKLPQKENFSEKFLKQWMNAMEACYKEFKNPRNLQVIIFQERLIVLRGLNLIIKKKPYLLQYHIHLL